MKGVNIGFLLLVMGIAVSLVCYKIEADQESAYYQARWDYLVEQYPGSYRPPEFADRLFAPIPPQPARLGVTLGKITAGIGLLIIFIKLVQKTE